MWKALLVGRSDRPGVQCDHDSVHYRLIVSLEAHGSVTKVGSGYATQLLNFLGIIAVIGQCSACTLLSNDGIVGVYPADRLGATDGAIIFAIGLRMRFDIYQVQDSPSDDCGCFLEVMTGLASDFCVG
jgi:hypothetical protein